MYMSLICIKYYWKDSPEISNIVCPGRLDNWGGRFLPFCATWILNLVNILPISKQKQKQIVLCFHSLQCEQSLGKEGDWQGRCWVGDVEWGQSQVQGQAPEVREPSVADLSLPSRETERHLCYLTPVKNMCQI